MASWSEETFPKQRSLLAATDADQENWSAKEPPLSAMNRDKKVTRLPHDTNEMYSDSEITRKKSGMLKRAITVRRG